MNKSDEASVAIHADSSGLKALVAQVIPTDVSGGGLLLRSLGIAAIGKTHYKPVFISVFKRIVRVKMKRVFDVLLALVVAPFGFIVCALVAVPIAIEARASPFFLQTRLGRGERPFRLLKLRTMRVATPSMASHRVGADNILVTGRMLRRLKIDELPQIWNVLNGSMSFIGPRPGLPNQQDLTEARRKNGTFALIPGITGVSQIQGLDMSTPELLAKTDKTYDGPWSLKRDLGILWATAAGAGSGDAVASNTV